MTVLLRFVFFVSLFAACQPPKPVEVPQPEVPDCALTTPQALGGRQGTRQKVALTPGADVKNVRVEQLASISDVVEDGALRVTLPYGATSARVVLAYDCAGATKLADVDFTVSPLQWSRAAEWTGHEGPSAREYFSMWLDGERLRVHGGFVYVPRQFTPDSALWELDVAAKTWREAPQSGAVPSVAGGRLVPSPDGRSALYFGGVDVVAMETPYQLKRLDLATGAWTDAPAASGGRGEYQPSFFFDAKRGRYLSVCGVNDGVGYHCDVRELALTETGGAWRTLVTEGTVPGARNGHAWAYDEIDDRLILFGGDRQGSTLGDTWALELSGATPTWRLLVEASPAAAPRRNMAWALDAANHRLLIWGGTGDGATAVPGVQALDLTAGLEQWFEVDAVGADPAVVPRPRASGAAVYDASKQRLLMGFGNSLEGQYADLWELAL